ncbi:MAG: SPFH domain-containing protein [Parasporobacterium sp.]|nr:SPFH domain-containing protein [Parasporobacterium sp.]
MGLISAALGAAGGVLADTWKEFFYCDSLDKDTLMVKGQKKVGNRSSNTKGSDNIITNGSGICVADGQCMIIVDNGKVVDICSEPGEYTYDMSSEPSLFTGGLGQSIMQTLQTMGKRISFGGDAGHDQRVYYFNTKEIIDNKFGTPNPVPFRIVDQMRGLDIDVSIRCSGVYSYKIADPVKFYANVAGNITDAYKRSQIDSQLKTEFISALQPAMGQLSALQLRPNEIVTHNTELENAMNQALTSKWADLRGIVVVSVALGSVTLPEEDQELIKQIQKGAALSNPTLAAGVLAGAQASAMEAAANNSAGAMAGFMGMGMANNAGANIAGLYQQGAAQQQMYGQQPQMNQQQVYGQQPQMNTQPQAEGSAQTPKFCSMCGNPLQQGARFCAQCGAKIQ